MNGCLIACASVLSLGLSLASSANATLLKNGDFETGDLTGWTSQTTENGSYGFNPGLVPLPIATPFDTTGRGKVSFAAQFRVGQVQFAEAQFSGSLLTQSVYLKPGQFELSANAASQSKWRNGSGGLLELMFEGEAIARHDFSTISPALIEYASLAGRFDVSTAGWYTVGVQLTRPFIATTTTPTQFIDNVMLVDRSQPVPEARGGWSVLLGGFGLGAVLRRRQSLG